MKAIRGIERAGAWASSRRPGGPSLPIGRGLQTLAAIIDSSDDAILGKTLDGTITGWNKGAEKLYGYSAQEIVGENIYTLVPPDRRDEMKQILERVERGERIDHLETLRIRKDGTPIEMSLTISPIRDGDAVVGASTIARDISERKQADQLRFELAAIVESSDDAILGKTLDGTITSWNAAAQRLYGYSAQEIVGKNVSTLVPPDRLDELADILERVERGERVGHLETVRIRKDGTPIEMSLTISPIRNGDGAIVGAATIVGASAIARDISERRRMEAAVAAAGDAEAEANRLKSEFLATMSHEIRTPMNGVIGMAGLLLDTELDSDQRQYAETVRSSGEALLTIINEILDFSKIEAGKLELEVVDFDLRTVVEQVADLLAERAHAKGLELAVLVEPDVPVEVRGDAGRLRQVVTNLVSNAVKFTDDGEVVIRVGLAEQTDHEALVRVEVADTGIGIAPESQAALFKPFSQVDASKHTHAGTGLGLAISKQLAALMGGEIGVESEPGEGSRFWFTARLSKRHATARRLPRPRDFLDGLRIMIVDDNQTNRQILDGEVRAWGMHSASAEGGEPALELLRAAAARGEPYDVALLDMEMPGMDGLALARAIRADHELPPLPLLLLTSSAKRDSAGLARRAGISAFLTKPVSQSRLNEALTMVMGQETQTARSETSPQGAISKAPARARPRLLLAEDNHVSQQVGVAMLQKLGYRTDVVANGAEAVEALSRIPYGAVLMDCQMPVMDGYQATREIRSAEGVSRRTPVIALTAAAMDRDRERCFAAGMDDYLSKPVALDGLADVLARWVGDENERGQDISAEPPAGRATDGIDPAEGNGAGILDEAVIAQLEDLEGDAFTRLMCQYLEDTSVRLEELRGALDRGDTSAVSAIAHKLNGSSATVGATAVSSVAHELEQLAKSGDLGNANALADRLLHTLEDCGAAIRRRSAQGVSDA